MTTCKINSRRAPHREETINNSVLLKFFRIYSLLPCNNMTQADSHSCAVRCLSLQPVVSFTLPGSETLICSSHACQKGENIQSEEKWVEKKGGEEQGQKLGLHCSLPHSYSSTPYSSTRVFPGFEKLLYK